MSTKIQGKYSGNGNRFIFYDPNNNHESVLPVADVVFYDEFLGQAFDVTHNWTVKDTSAIGSTTPALVADSASGYVALPLDAQNEKQESGIYPNDFRTWLLNQSPVFEARVRPQVLATLEAEMYIGLAGDYAEGIIATDGPAEHIFFVMDGGGVVTIYTDDKSNDNYGIATGVTLTAADWADFKNDCANPADKLFFNN